jgi:predicted MPP superfamily phosphohydrolase
MNPFLFFFVFLSTFALLHLYISKRFIFHLHLSGRKKFLLRLFLYLNFIGIIGYALARYYIDVPNWLYFLFSLPIGIVFLLFCTTLIYDISRLLLNKLPLSPKRREFFKRSLDLSSLTIATALSAKAMHEARFVELEYVEVKLKKLKKSYTLAQLSDVHIGGLIDAAFIEEITKRVNALNVDLVIITGDLVDMDVKKIAPALEVLKTLNSTYGTYFVAGNHEYFHNLEHIIEQLKKLGVHVLENESRVIGSENEGFNLAGVYDIFGYRAAHHLPDLNAALKNTNQELPTILLAHQPKFIEEVKSGVDLMLSGHTHGGQLYPFKYLVALAQPYIAGLYRHDENLQIYVNKGTGFWGPPMRLGASSEITHIKLTPA